MKILIITFYYPPDLSAGSFRIAALVEAMLERIGDDGRIEIITTTPNRYANQNTQDDNAPIDERISIARIAVPGHQSGIADQAKSFAAFARSAWKKTRRSSPDLVVATSSRLLTAALGSAIARRLGKPYYLDIRDIFTETIGSIFKKSPVRLAMPIISPLEKWTLRNAARINVVAPAFIDYFAPRLGHRNFSVFTNGVDDLFADFPRKVGRRDSGGPPIVLAAGNIGAGQGLEHIVPQLAKAYPEARFRFIGGGGRRTQLQEAIAREGVTNVELIDPMARSELIGEYAQARVLFMHLNDLPAFDRVVPSKLFEYAATGLPVLAGVRGWSRTLLEQLPGVECFAPCNAEQGIAALGRLLSGPSSFDRAEFTTTYSRRTIMGKMADEIVAIAASGGSSIAPAATEKSLHHDPQV